MDLHTFNTLPKEEKSVQLSRCCGSTCWVQGMLEAFPFDDLVELLEQSEEKWYACSPSDWLEAFQHHPKIGDTKSLVERFSATASWASAEQAAASKAGEDVFFKLARLNAEYEEKFGFIFIVCATGKPATEMLSLLDDRLSNEYDKELNNAAEEQLKITQLRLQKLLA